jgi:hypothetical protein
MFFDVEFQDKNIVFLLTRSSYSEFTQLTFSLHILPELQYYFRLKAVTFDHTTVHIYLERGLEPKKWWRKWKNCWTSVPSLSKVLTSLLPWQSNVYNLLWLSRGVRARSPETFSLVPKKDFTMFPCFPHVPLIPMIVSACSHCKICLVP